MSNFHHFISTTQQPTAAKFEDEVLAEVIQKVSSQILSLLHNSPSPYLDLAARNRIQRILASEISVARLQRQSDTDTVQRAIASERRSKKSYLAHLRHSDVRLRRIQEGKLKEDRAAAIEDGSSSISSSYGAAAGGTQQGGFSSSVVRFTNPALAVTAAAASFPPCVFCPTSSDDIVTLWVTARVLRARVHALEVVRGALIGMRHTMASHDEWKYKYGTFILAIRGIIADIEVDQRRFEELVESKIA